MSDTNKPPLDPHRTVLVCKHNGKEVGRIAATAKNANAYMEELAKHYGGLQVDYIEDPTYAMVSQLFSGGRNG